ncbi:SAM-dependent methyltransferase [Leptothrix ochracea]|uniref:SAM-dependent methyltransferase n=1 Tax=Leptothrix ochracea TaxID=735331 RepID=UPI0034E1DBBF
MSEVVAKQGRLILMPNTLDLGTVADGSPPPDLHDVLPMGVIRRAAELRFWVVENAKSARAFLKRVDQVMPLGCPLQQITLTELPRPQKGQSDSARGGGRTEPDLGLLLAPAQAGNDVGLLSEAGLPAVADPGALLVKAAHRLGVSVVPLSGPSSLMLALAASGLNGQSFAFVGYVPTEASERAKRLKELENHSRRWQQTQLLIETPYRNAALLAALMRDLQPTTWLSVSCGLTLSAEGVRTLRVADWRKEAAAFNAWPPAHVPAVFSFLAT